MSFTTVVINPRITEWLTVDGSFSKAFLWQNGQIEISTRQWSLHNSEYDFIIVIDYHVLIIVEDVVICG
ncbi:hypothetical protein HUK49_10040 [Limosilactobacillus sp. c11Ua_112_M]|uniref:hypothetical protein n=1 Tax=Limosilactobacillus TaxID=2742598 RepID=UPI00178086F5|nr:MULTISPECIES: hypothetical protein [Limosilactobacillus]MBD8088225.1 hypothetical protein [Limosilactobacillus portuensis]MEC4742764.1 hypothetical protein [Limosilactobacillus sp. c10Ua_36]